jgi:iron complex outermembrane receptor protein
VIITGRAATSQDRLGDFEDSTAGWFTMDASFELEVFRGGWQHMIVVRGENLLDREYRNHLSRIKSIQPEVGRGVSLLYRVFF